MILSETLLFIFTMVVTGLLLFLLIYFIITLSDLECDYINAQQCCHRLNMWVLPKLCAQVLITFVFLLHGHYWFFLINMIPSGLFVYELYKVPRGNMGVYDPFEIHNRGQLKRHMRDVLITISYFLISFFVFLYCMILAMLKAPIVPLHPTPTPNDFNEF